VQANGKSIVFVAPSAALGACTVAKAMVHKLEWPLRYPTEVDATDGLAQLPVRSTHLHIVHDV